MASKTIETRRADSFGGISRDKNTRRLLVSPAEVRTLAVTGTWVLEANSNVVSLATDDVGGDGELLFVPCNVEASDMIVNGSTVVDRGIRVIGLEISYVVAASALADIDFFLYKTTLDAEGVATAAAITATTTFDTDGDTGREIDEHRVLVSIAEKDRFFLDGGTLVHGVIDMEDGTASDVNINSVIWHLQRVEE